MNFNHCIRNITCAIFVGLVAAACSLGAQAQTYTQNYIYTIAGGGTVPTTPLSLDLPGPTAAIKDGLGNIYIAAQDTAYVYKLNTSGTLSVFAGLGYGGYSNDGKKATNALIGGVTGMAADKAGNIYLADAVGSRIRKITPAGIISTVAGDGVKCDHAAVCGDGGPATSADLNLPEAVALDSAGNLYIADMGDNRIRVVNVGTTTITIAGVSIPPGYIKTVAGNSQQCGNSQGTKPTCGDGGPATSAFLTMPFGVAVDGSGNIYIADTHDQEIRIVAAGQSIIQTFAGNGLSCFNQRNGCGDGGAPTSALLWLPKGVFTDAAGNVYIADTSSNRIRYVAKGSNVITTLVDNTGALGFSGDGGPATAAKTDGPVGVFVDASGNMLIADTGNQVVRQVTAGATPTISTIAGGSMGGDGGLPTKATLANPWDVAKDATGDLYIVDQGNNRIRKITNPGVTNAVITTVVGTGQAGYTGDNGPATSATLNGPSAIALDTAGNLYIVDANNLVVRAVNTGTSIITLGSVTIAPGAIATVFGNANLSCNPMSACGDGGPPLGAIFQGPLFVTLDSSNNVYVSDYQGGKVREWNILSNIVSTVAGTGFQGYQGNGGTATLARIDHPAGLAIQSNGNIIIDDQWADTVQYVAGGIINTYALNTNAKFAGDGGPCPVGSMFNPLALAVNSENDIFISGGNDNLVQRCSNATGIFSTVAGAPTRSYQGAFSGDGGPAINARMANLGALVDANNGLYIADGGNNRIRYVPLAPAVTLSSSALKMGQYALGTTGHPVPLTLTGAGGADVNFSGLTFTGPNASDFSVQTNGCGTPVSPQAACTVQLVLTPHAYGPETGTLNIADNVTGSPQLVTLSGFGPDFAIADSPNTLTVTAGSAGVSTVSLTPQARFAQAVTLACSGLPAGASCSFSNNPVQLYGGSVQSSTLTIQTSATTPVGTYTVTTTGVYTTLSHPATITLTVQ
ncbi:MAG: repeat containing protein [Candidatus Sulfotelmatobacter sp.]|nr:repeat containing protein [Candidatus Sulfotelmatobacter sp.]